MTWLPTDSTSRRQSKASRERSVFLAAVAQRDLLLGRVLRRLLFRHLPGHRAVAGHESRDLLEAGAVPLLELDHPRALVIGAACLDRWEEARRTQLLDARLRQIQMLEAPAHLLGRHHLALAELRLGDADRLDDQDPVDN